MEVHPDSPGLARGGAHGKYHLAGQGIGRPAGPLNGILQYRRHGMVKFGGRDEQAVGALDGLSKLADRLREPGAVPVSVKQR